MQTREKSASRSPCRAPIQTTLFSWVSLSTKKRPGQEQGRAGPGSRQQPPVELQGGGGEQQPERQVDHVVAEGVRPSEAVVDQQGPGGQGTEEADGEVEIGEPGEHVRGAIRR